MTDILRYRVEKDGEHFVITHGEDNDLAWAGSHWVYKDELGAQPMTFPDRGRAMQFAHELFGQASTAAEAEEAATTPLGADAGTRENA
jgi:hypothetical protein